MLRYSNFELSLSVKTQLNIKNHLEVEVSQGYENVLLILCIQSVSLKGRYLCYLQYLWQRISLR